MDATTIKLQHPQLLLKPEENNFDMFCYALQIVFDIPDEIGNAKTSERTGLMYDVVNYDFLWRPNIKGAVTYYHWLTLPTSEREPILSMYSYLFQNSEPYYNDPYEFSETALANRNKFYAYLRQKYLNAEQYLEHIAGMLDKDVASLPMSPSAMNKKVWQK